MRGDKAWVAGIHETAKMSSIVGLPTQGSDVTVLITRVHLHPLCVLVEFWGKFSQERTADYEFLAKDIQSPGNTFQEFEGNPGDQCLVQVDGTWYRSRIVSRNGSTCSVFLFDKGRTHGTTTSKLAWGKNNHFQLPPQVEFCVLANVIPLSPENRWSPVASEFLRSLSGKSVKAHVQDVLVLHRTFLLRIPCISKQLYEMGIARKLSPDVFQDFVLMSLQTHSGAEASPETQTSMGAAERLHKKELFLYPELPAGTMEIVVVTEVTNPQRIFCQLKVFSQELKKLSGQITQRCEGRMTNCIVNSEMIGFPCAARGSDGTWYRSVLQQVCSTSGLVEVLNVDSGTKQFVQVENVRPLAAEFFRMPIVTYICSLHGVIDRGVGWTSSQIDYLRSLLLHKTMIAKFEYQSISEGVHYVTLFVDENTSINNLFGSKESCFLESEKTLGDYAICRTSSSHKHSTRQERCRRRMSSPGQSAEEKEGIVEKMPAEGLSVNSSHVAVVQHISDPSEFWIQTQNSANELDELMDSIYHLYKDSVDKDVVRNPTVGFCCAARAEDGDFYRATVAQVGDTQIKVFLVDYGNTEVVDRNDIRTLPDKLKKLPRLSLKCSLAGVRPKDGKWSRSACDIFMKAVKDKELTVHVMAKYDEGYVVQLADPEAQGDGDLSTLMCSSGFAERAETKRQTSATTQPAIVPQLPDARLSGVFKTLNTFGPACNDRIPTFKEHMFPIGSVLDVGVSYIQSPNDFWCQLVHNAGHLKLLMHDMQARYADSEFQPLVEVACVARHPDNGMWYRALVIHKHETPEVDVLFVDYGQTETVSLYDLRRISPQFLALQGQAFRCSLLNPVDPTSAINEWNEEAVARFHSFVETAASSVMTLKCTIYAVMYSEQKIVFNIVDLETPFESVCTSMVNLVKSAPPKKATGPPFRLDTYYYSTHNVKTGTEEQVTVTCVNSVHKFYCHLARNAGVIKDLKSKVNNLCLQLENVKLPTVLGTLCFAKYTDGHWYRGQIKATKPAMLVHFVDYGDTIEVEKSDLLPVPREASDIMSVPVQAVVCSLCDIPADVSSEMNRWFETRATECTFRALVVAREPDGKLLVELYHGNTQVNSKIKKMFQVGNVVHQGRRALEASVNAQKTQNIPIRAAEMEDHTQTINNNVSAPKPARQMRIADVDLQAAPKPLRHVCESGQKIKTAPLELYIPPHQRPSTGTPRNTGNGSQTAGGHIKTGTESLPTNTKLIKSKSPDTDSQKESNVEEFPKVADLPSQSITSDMEADVYVSHCNSPLSFYVQLVREEDGIFSLVEKLNDPESNPQTPDVRDLHPGDLVQAEFADDSSWYRAVVREIHSETMALVEFVDFGNTSLVPISRMSRLNKTFLQLPMYSAHCMLSEAAGLGRDKVLNPEVASTFKEVIGGNGEKVLKCHFIRRSGSVWEVGLEDSGVKVVCKVPTTCSDGSEVASEKPEQVEKSDRLSVSLSLCYHHQEFSEGQTVDVYITAINDARSFWCQPVASEELDKITSSLSEVGDPAHHQLIDLDSLSAGSPCIALFSDDGFWYRAEVIHRDGPELAVLFVDYGNKSQVNVTAVREMPPDLMETPRQAFLCELEGFDASHGSWDGGAADELSALTTDKVLELTVGRVTREEGKLKLLVWVKCEGRVINEALKTWWKSSTTGNQTPLQCDSALPEVQPKVEGHHMDAGVEPLRDHGGKQSPAQLVEPHKDILPCDGDEPTLPPLQDEGEHGTLTLSLDESVLGTDEGTEEEGLSGMDSIGPDDLSSPLDVNPPDAIDESEIRTDPESLPPDDRTYSEEESRVDKMNVSDPAEERGGGDVTMARATCVPNTTTVKVSREALRPQQSVVLPQTHENICGDVKQVQSDLVQPSCVVPASDTPTDQDSGDGVPQEELPCVGTHVESDLMTREEAVLNQTDLMTREEAVLNQTDLMTREETFLIQSDLKTREETVLNQTDLMTREETVLIQSDLMTREDTVPIQTDLMTREETALLQTDLMTREDTVPIQTDLMTREETVLIQADLMTREDTVPIQTDLMTKEERVLIQADLMTREETVLIQSDPMTREEAVSHPQETCSDRETRTAPPQHSGDGVEEVTCLTEVCSGIRLLLEDQDKVAEPNEPSGTSAGDDGLSRPTSEMDSGPGDESSVTGDESSALHKDPPCGLPCDSGPPCDSAPPADGVHLSHLSELVEEVTCLIRDFCLTDDCTGPLEEAEREQTEHGPPTPTQDFSDSLLEEEMSPADDDNDSFEARLSKITHLSLIINDGSADRLQPEE